jgi:antitoxin (DNA-binding transcriptional repressor) of toxin-antitoxin stability system
MFGTRGTIAERMKRMPVSEARKAFPDLVNQAFYAGEITVVTRRGKGDVAAIVPMNVFNTGNVLNPTKPPQKKPSESASSQSRKAPIKLSF